jgi:hypothetical protein
MCLGGGSRTVRLPKPTPPMKMPADQGRGEPEWRVFALSVRSSHNHSERHGSGTDLEAGRVGLPIGTLQTFFLILTMPWLKKRVG